MEYFEDNYVRIADKDIRTYLGQCDKKLNKYPEIILSFGETFAEKGRTIVSILGAIGIKVHSSNKGNLLGNLKFKRQEGSIINKKTGKRESKVFYQITLSREEKLSYEDIDLFEYEDLKNAKIIKEEEPIKNELKISDNSLDFYLGQCNLDFQSYDQVVLSTTIENIELLKYIIKILNPLGIQVDEDYIDRRRNKIIFYAVEKERINPMNARRERKTFYKLGITKIPELFMYTNPESAIEVE
jgi:hypothetical protein